MVFGAFWNLALKAFAVLAAAGVFSLVLGRSSAAKRHAAWLAGILGVLLLPVLMIKIPQWQISSKEVPAIAPLARITSFQPVQGFTISPSKTKATSAKADSASAALAVPPELDSRSVNYGPLLLWVWFGISLMVFVRWTMRLLSLAAAKRRAIAWWGHSPLGIAEKLGTKRKVEVLLSPDVTVPATAGFFKPFVLLPADVSDWSQERLDMVFGHELAHVKRNDWLWLQVSGLACALYPFNPLAWYAAYRLRMESEQASDDLVLSLGYGPKAYATELLDIARSASLRVPAALSMACSAKVENRLRSIMDGKRNRKVLAGKALACGLGATAFVVAALAAFSPVLAEIRAAAVAPTPEHETVPEIPIVHSVEVSKGVYLAKDGIGSLPGGVRVRLVGLSPNVANPDIWNPNGTMLGDPIHWRQGGIYWQGPQFHHVQMGHPDSFQRNFYWEIESDTGTNVSTTGFLADNGTRINLAKWSPSSIGQDLYLNDTELAAHQAAFGIIDTSVATKQDKGTYRFGVASGPWGPAGGTLKPSGEVTPFTKNTLADFSGVPMACSIVLDKEPRIFCVDASGRSHVLYLSGDPSILLYPGVARRVLLYDAAGAALDLDELSINSAPSYSADGYATYYIHPSEFKRIARVALQTRYYQWLEFRDIPLKPNFEADIAAKLASHIKGTATGVAPGYSKTLQNGAVVSIESVCRGIDYEKMWRFTGQPNWRADGKVLATAPSLRLFDMPDEAWGKMPIVRTVISVTGNRKGANIALKAPNVPSGGLFEEVQDVPLSFAGPLPFLRAVPPNIKSLNIKVGVANGEWKTVASRPINVAELPRIKPQKDYDVKDSTGIYITLGRIDGKNESAQLEFGEPGRGKADVLVADLNGKADRCVAVLKNGRRVVLKPSFSGMIDTRISVVPARHGEYSEIYNDFLASDIAKVEIQARPFEWVEFDGIALNPKL